MSEEPKLCTTSDKPITEETRKINPETGMQNDYIILCEEERAKGFVRPVRTTYRHVGVRPKYPTRELTPEEKERYADCGYVLFEIYPERAAPKTGKFWTQKQLESGCGMTTTMSRPIAETYARQVDFYGATMCIHCGKHFPVGEDGEFVWGDGSRVGT